MSDKELQLLIKDKEVGKLELGKTIAKFEQIYGERLEKVNKLRADLLVAGSELEYAIPKARKKAYLSSNQDLDTQSNTLFIKTKKLKVSLQLDLAEAIKDFESVSLRLDNVRNELKILMIQQDKISKIATDRKVLDSVIKSEAEED